MPTPDDKLDRILVSQTQIQVSLATVVAEVRGLHDGRSEDRARLDRIEAADRVGPSRADLSLRLTEHDATLEALKAFMWRAIGWLTAAGAVVTIVVDKAWR
jgi:hypothetical protein